MYQSHDDVQRSDVLKVEELNMTQDEESVLRDVMKQNRILCEEEGKESSEIKDTDSDD